MCGKKDRTGLNCMRTSIPKNRTEIGLIRRVRELDNLFLGTRYDVPFADKILQ